MRADAKPELTTDEWQRLQSLFAAACDLPTTERDAFVNGPAVAEALRTHLAGMLASDAAAAPRLARVIESAARAVPAGDRWIGRRFGAYRLVREIGRGGMGVVYEAVRDDYDKRVAVKVAPWAPDAVVIRERFRQEGRILAALDDPNIARFLDGGTEDDVPFVVMEYVEGRPIGDYCRERNLDLPARLSLFRQVCAAVHAAHEKLVVHRDLKPANILVGETGVPKLLDFGIAKLLDPVAGAGHTVDMAMCTPDYGSPEQVRNGPVTVKTDVYSLGLILYELLTGVRAQIADSSSALALDRSICETEPALPSDRVAALGDHVRARRLRGDLDAIVMKATRKEPERRYASAAALSDDIARYLAGRAVQARRGTAIYRSARFVRRHRAAAVASLLLLASGAAIAVLALGGARLVSRGATERGTAVPFAQAPLKQLTTKGRVRWIATSPDGRSFAYTLSERGESRESVWLAQTDATGDRELVPPSDATYNGLAFAPDGKTIYVSRHAADRAAEGLFKLPAGGGVAERVSSHGGPIALSPDGRRIAFTRSDRPANASRLLVADLDGRGERELARRPFGRPFLTALSWSPDGERLACAAVTDTAGDNREFFIVSVADGRVEQLTSKAWAVISNLTWLRDGRGIVAVAADRHEIDRRLWVVAHPGGDARPISDDTDTYGSGLSLSADGTSLVAVQLRRESNLWVAASGDPEQARQVTFSSINGMFGWRGIAWTPAKRIVFTGTIDHTGALFSIDADGGRQQQLTPAGFLDQRPAVTADGRAVIFESNRTGASEIWRVNIDGTDLRPLTSDGANFAPHLTPDGRWIVYFSVRGGDALMSRIPVAGGAPVRITDVWSASFPRVSPDGALVACRYRLPGEAARLGILRLADGVPVALFDVPRSARFDDGLGWTPDGRGVCYRDGANGVWRQEVSGGAPRRIAGMPAEKIYTYAWSHDGAQFAFTRGREIADAVLLRNAR